MTKLLHSRALFPHPGFFLSKSKAEGVYRYGSVIFQLIRLHSGDISSCRIVHFQNSLSIGEVGIWVDLLVERKKFLKDLSLKCLPGLREISKLEISKPHFRCGVFDCLGSLEFINYTIDFGYAFENCKRLKTLKLKWTHLDDETLSGILENCEALESLSLIHSTGLARLIVRNSKLKVLHIHALWVDELGIYTPNLDVLSLDSTRCLLQNNLSKLSMDLDLNYIEEAMELPFVLRLCISLQVLEIVLPFYSHKSSVSSLSDHPLSYPMSMIWERLELCNCIRQKLKFVYVRGFKGELEEVEFAKYLITRATMMKKITIVVRDNYSMDVAKTLLSLPRASDNLSINLKYFNAYYYHMEVLF
ncbi:Leucine-rich repeat domain superfamily [Sesbania bispinosa]|nr:Leucine-rich repeat domain superfamily [Sesbania bispinosa]